MSENMKMFTIVLMMSLVLLVNCDENQPEEIWEQDLTDTFKIDASDLGIQKVNLKCSAEKMYVQLETEKEFTGVMYTRGSFHRQSEPCFTKPKTERGSRSLELNFTFNQCQTINDGDLYTNIIVIQNDPELVTPGDSAFSLECDFRKPREHLVEANMQARDRIAFGSRITLTSPDPSAIKDIENNDSVYSDTNECSYVPSNKRQKRIQKVHGTVENVPIEGEREPIKDEL